MINISANNQIIIDAKTFKIYHVDVDYYDDYGLKRTKPIGRGKNFEDACRLAQKLAEDYDPLEYGIAFINMEKNEDTE